MSVKYGILGLLSRQAQHGYELRRTFEQLTGGFWQLNHGQIYQSLERLESDGLVRHKIEHDDAGPDRKVYEVTEAGRERLQEWIDQPEPRTRPLRDELFIRMAVMADGPPAELLNLLEAHRTVYLGQMSALTRSKNRAADEAESSSGSRRDELEVEQLLLDAAIYHCEADLRWLDHCEAMINRRLGRSPS